MEHILETGCLEQFESILRTNERSRATIEKYMRDLRGLLQYLGGEAQTADGRGQVLTKELVVAYKQQLQAKYSPASVNSMLAAINCFCRERGWYDCMVKSVRIQRDAFRSGEKELSRQEYIRLLQAAKARRNQRLYLLLQTICSTGIRVSELPFITVEGLHAGKTVVALKGKTRTVILPVKLCRELKAYVRERGIRSGSIFVTRTGKPMNRSNIWQEMKSLCEDAGVDRHKVFPHNLRHLFACTYYSIEKDIAHLADILGHSNMNTTRIYTMVSWAEQTEKIEQLGLVI